jgi:hypothetical protein
LHADLRAINRSANAAFAVRERPRIRSVAVRPSLASEQPGREILPSYPSARTMATRVWAEVSGQLFPERRQDLLEAAADSAWLRVIGGAHYPTDVTGGRMLAEGVIRAFEASAEYRKAYERAEREAGDLRAAVRPTELPPEPLFLLAAEQVAAALPPPPGERSLADRAELSAVLLAQAGRSAFDVRWIAALDRADVVWFLRSQLPSSRREEPLPHTLLLLGRVRAQAERVLKIAREKYLRARPAVADSRVQAALDVAATPALPSAKLLTFATQLAVVEALYPPA